MSLGCTSPLTIAIGCRCDQSRLMRLRCFAFARPASFRYGHGQIFLRLVRRISGFGSVQALRSSSSLTASLGIGRRRRGFLCSA